MKPGPALGEIRLSCYVRYEVQLPGCLIATSRCRVTGPDIPKHDSTHVR